MGLGPGFFSSKLLDIERAKSQIDYRPQPMNIFLFFFLLGL